MLVENIRNLPGKGAERGKVKMLHSGQSKNKKTIMKKALIFFSCKQNL